MILLSALLVGAGIGAVVIGFSRTKLAVDGGVHVVAPVEEDREETAGNAGLAYRAVEPLLKSLGNAARRLSPTGRIDLMRQRIVYAGMESSLTLERVLVYKAVAAAGGFVFGLAVSPGRMPAIVWGVMIGFVASFIPDLWLDSRARDRQSKIARDLPEALDLLAITVEAGLGLEQALDVVTENLEGPLGAEFKRTLEEIGLGVSRRAAIENLRRRTNVPALSAFVVALIQADQIGAPVAEVLRVQSGQVRLKRRQWAREKAAQTPVKILFPLIFCIFPSLFVVLIGPGVINIMKALVN